MERKPEHRKLGYIYVIIASAFFAMIGVISKMAMNTGITPFILLTYQYIFTVLFLLIYILATDRKALKVSFKDLRNMALQGMIGAYGTSIFFYLAIEQITVGIATMILFLYPAAVNIFFAATGSRKIGKASIIALIMALVGSVMVLNLFTGGELNISLIGILFGLGACICYTFYNIFADLKFSKIRPVIVSFYGGCFSLIVSLVFTPSFFQFDVKYTWITVGYFVLLAVTSGIIPAILMYKGIRYIGSDKASIVASSELPMAIILAFLFLGEKMIITQLLGIAMIVASVVLLDKADRNMEAINNRI